MTESQGWVCPKCNNINPVSATVCIHCKLNEEVVPRPPVLTEG